jgi:hypothetical protein
VTTLGGSKVNDQIQSVWVWAFVLMSPNVKVSDGSQPPVALDLSLSESAGSRSLDRRVGRAQAPDHSLIARLSATTRS